MQYCSYDKLLSASELHSATPVVAEWSEATSSCLITLKMKFQQHISLLNYGRVLGQKLE